MVNPSPAITFSVNLELNSTEAIGPNTNQKETGMLHPDLSVDQGFIDLGNELKDQRKYTRSAVIGVAQKTVMGVLGAEVDSARDLKHGDTFTLYGQKALEIRQKFASGAWNNYVPTGGLGAILTVE